MGYENDEEARAQQRAVESLMNEMNDECRNIKKCIHSVIQL
jgi:hypothetical protein